MKSAGGHSREILARVVDAARARRLLTGGLAMACAPSVDAAAWRRALRWTEALAARGEPAPPAGFLADMAALARARDGFPSDAPRAPPRELAIGPTFPAAPEHAAWRWRHETFVLGKLLADQRFARAARFVDTFQGVAGAEAGAFLAARLRARAAGGAGGESGVLLPPAVPRHLLLESDERLAEEAARPLAPADAALLLEQYAALARGFADAPRCLSDEDLWELEHGLFRLGPAQRLAARQVLDLAAPWRGWPPPPRRAPGAGAFATPQRQASGLPAGGYAELTTRGDWESLLPSQWALWDDARRPDLFDFQCAHGELLYYARDENFATRPPRTLRVEFAADLAAARVRDPGAPAQRLTLAQAVVWSLLENLRAALGETGWRRELRFAGGADENGPNRGDAYFRGDTLAGEDALAEERGLWRLLLARDIARGVARVESAEPAGGVVARGAAAGACTDTLLVGERPRGAASTGRAFTGRDSTSRVAQMLVSAPTPTLLLDDAALACASWQQAARTLFETFAAR